MLIEWNQADEHATWVPGVFEEGGDGGLRRHAVGLDELHADAPAQIHMMLEARLHALCFAPVPSSARICSMRFIGAIGGRCIGTIGMVCPGALFHKRQRALLCAPMNIGGKSEH
jgi:hypothetical protein